MDGKKPKEQMKEIQMLLTKNKQTFGQYQDKLLS